jgi:hypothetical protein
MQERRKLSLVLCTCVLAFGVAAYVTPVRADLTYPRLRCDTDTWECRVCEVGHSCGLCPPTIVFGGLQCTATGCAEWLGCSVCTYTCNK